MIRQTGFAKEEIGALIAVELVDASDNNLIWRDQYSRRMSDIMVIAEDFARRVRAVTVEADRGGAETNRQTLH